MIVPAKVIGFVAVVDILTPPLVPFPIGNEVGKDPVPVIVTPKGLENLHVVEFEDKASNVKFCAVVVFEKLITQTPVGVIVPPVFVKSPETL